VLFVQLLPAHLASAIAESVGYASEQAFIRAFRRWSGMAPKQYARTQRDPYDMAKSGTQRAA
jgi:AraC-like DNA-binding protein